MNDLLVYAGALTLAGQQVAENLFGGLVKGAYMRYLAIATTVGLAYAGWALGWGPTAGWDTVRVGVLGVLAGLGSNVFDALLGRVLPKAKEATLSKAMAKMMERPETPPLPPAPPRFPR